MKLFELCNVVLCVEINEKKPFNYFYQVVWVSSNSQAEKDNLNGGQQEDKGHHTEKENLVEEREFHWKT